ncbi:MAG: aminoacyl-tRNA hydrolase [Phycisphaerales bacterium]|nr:MAG: aminoacyl-tRNA hydrolase [Phycisphaerales bacterium]
MDSLKMVVGLGNPGDKYVDTRHNAGFKVIDSLAEALRIELRREKFGGRFGSGGYAGEKLILLKPWRFMNASGQVVATAVGFYRLSLCNLLVVTDDMALEPGRIRIRAQGSAGGHNGLADIIEKLGTSEFGRLRIGVGSRGEDMAVDYVLDRPTESQKQALNEAIERARDAVLCWIRDGIDKAMSEFNRSDA